MGLALTRRSIAGVCVVFLAACSTAPSTSTVETHSGSPTANAPMVNVEPVFEPQMIPLSAIGCDEFPTAASWCSNVERLAVQEVSLMLVYTGLRFDPESLPTAMRICADLLSGPTPEPTPAMTRVSILAEGSLLVLTGIDGCAPVIELDGIDTPRRWEYVATNGTTVEVVESAYTPFTGSTPERIEQIKGFAEKQSCAALSAEVREGEMIGSDMLFSPMVRRSWSAFGVYARDLSASLRC